MKCSFPKPKDQTGRKSVLSKTERQVQGLSCIFIIRQKNQLCNIEDFIRRQSHSQNNTCLFLASLSVADLLFLLLYLPLDVWRQVDSSVYQVDQIWTSEQLMAVVDRPCLQDHQLHRDADCPGQCHQSHCSRH